MLEYLPGTKSRPYITLHHNYRLNDGRFQHPLCSNGWLPLAEFPEEARDFEEYWTLGDIIHNAHLPYEVARDLAGRTLSTILKLISRNK